MKLQYRNLIHSEIAGFNRDQFPPFQNLDYPDRERLILHMINTFNARRRSFAIKRAVAQKANPKKVKKPDKKVDLITTLSSLSDEELITLLKNLKVKP